MKIIVGSRQSGKTEALIRRANAIDGVIVCMNHQHIRSIEKKALAIGESIPTMVSVYTLPSSLVSTEERILVDEAGAVLQILIGHSIDTLNISIENESNS